MKIKIEQDPWNLEVRTRDDDRRDVLLSYYSEEDDKHTTVKVSSGQLHLLGLLIKAFLRFREAERA